MPSIPPDRPTSLNRQTPFEAKGTPERSASAIVLATVFIDLIGFGIVLPILPLYGARYGASDASIGGLVASFSLMQFALAPWWGRLSDRIGRRPVILIGLLGSAASYLLFALADSFAMLLISRLVAGAAGANVNVAQAYLADTSAVEHRTRVMGRVGAAFGLGFILGPALGGFASHWGESAPGFVAAGLCTANFVLAYFLLPETLPYRPTEGQASQELHWTRLLVPFSIMFCITLPFTTIHALFPLYSERRLGYSTAETSYLFVYMGLMTVLVQGWLVGRLAQRFVEERLMVSGSILSAVGCGGLALTFGTALFSKLPLLALLLSISAMSLGGGLVAPSVTSYVSRVAPMEEQGAALGSLQGVAALARIIGPPAMGLLSQVASARVPFFTAAGVALLASAFSGIALRRGA